MANERLTRQEISWLLAQEARGAARALRDGVTRLTQPPRPSASETQIQHVPEVETSLAALDDAIGILSALQDEPRSSRRGRIDLAALLYRVAPEARIEMAPGLGTEVFGNEDDLFRMLHVLLSLANTDPSGDSVANQSVEIGRDGDFVRISVELGPDSSSGSEVERRWLSRMALRHGGRLEFKGGRQTVYLPADGATDQREVVALRKELEQAQQLGEAYARELAQAFAADAAVGTPPASAPAEDGFGILAGLALAVHGKLRDIVEAARGDVRAAKDPELGERLRQRAGALAELGGALEAFAECRNKVTSVSISVANVIDAAVEAVQHAAVRRGVAIEVKPSAEQVHFATTAAVFELMVRQLLLQALDATPAGEVVTVEWGLSGGVLRIRVGDGGPIVPSRVQDDVMRYRADPAAYGRPNGPALLFARSAAERLGASLSFGTSVSGRSEVEVSVPQLART